MKKFLIVLLLIAAQIAAFCSISKGQDRGNFPPLTKPVDTILLADETTLKYTKTEAQIKCSNESVFNELFKSHGTLFKRFTCTWKTDRHGRYKYYVIYLSQGDAEIIKSWAKINL